MTIWSAERWSVSTQSLAPRGDLGAPVVSTTAMSTGKKSSARAGNIENFAHVVLSSPATFDIRKSENM
jgi:hypothetical protein